MTIETYLTSATQKLVQAGVGTARLDVLVLLEDILSTNRAQLLAHPEREIPAADTQKLDELVARRAGHEPLAYIRGKVEFYGREFIMTPAVLVPRPESETMIELLKRFMGEHGLEAVLAAKNGSDASKNGRNSMTSQDGMSLDEPQKASDFDKKQKNSEISEKNNLTSKVFSRLKIADVGTGSGALGITAALELPGSQVELLEIDPAALLVAQQNASKFELKLPVSASDLLDSATLQPDVLLCNLPYVPDAFTINQAALQEPKLAIFGGPDGLDLYRRLFAQIQAGKAAPRLILAESLPPQHSALAILAADYGYLQVVEDDFIQAFALGD